MISTAQYDDNPEHRQGGLSAKYIGIERYMSVCVHQCALDIHAMMYCCALTHETRVYVEALAHKGIPRGNTRTQ